jgi:hypothetical protein
VLRPVVEEARIEATATRGTAFPEDIRVLGGQGVNYVVDAKHVVVVVRRSRHLVDATVVVPLDVSDIGSIENLRD